MVWSPYLPLIATIGAAGLAAFASVLTVVIGKSKDNKREIDYKNREIKLPLYSRFLNHLMDHYFINEKFRKKISQDEEIRALIDFNKEMMLWGSDEVLKRYCSFTEHVKKNGNHLIGLKKLERLIKSMRKDLGYKNKSLEFGDISKTFITDFDEIKKAK